jgi:hypothetical protein
MPQTFEQCERERIEAIRIGNEVLDENARLRDLLRRAEPHLGQFKLRQEIRAAIEQKAVPK